MKKKRRRKNSLLLALLCLFFLGLVLFSGWKVYSILSAYRENERVYSELASVVSSSEAQASPPGKAASAPSSAAAQEGTASDPAQAAPEPEEIERSPITVDFAELDKIGSEVAGWIYLPDTIINYPVVHGLDNDFYLSRYIDGRKNFGGTPFVDCGCEHDFAGRSTIIYGHNMKNGSMFAPLNDYAEQSFFDEHPCFYLNTPSQNYRADIFSCFNTDPESAVYTFYFPTDQDYADYLNMLLSASEVDCGVSPTVNERVVVLSTCSSSGGDVRFVVCGVLHEIG